MAEERADRRLTAFFFATTYPERTAALVVYGSFAHRLVGGGYPWGKSPEAHPAYAMQVESDCGRQADMHVMRPSADDAMAWS